MSAYEFHSEGPAERAILTFGSYQNPNRSAPSYAFMKTCLNMKARFGLSCDNYYFLAKTNDWYFDGIKGLGEDFDASVTALAVLTKKYKHITCVGNSMGGYAAIAFGLLIGAHRIVAFSPQTRFDAAFLKLINENRWKEALAALGARADVHAYAVDAIAEKRSFPQTRVDIYAGTDCPQDLAYVDQLEQIPDFFIHRITGKDHDLVHAFREGGKLEDILYNAVLNENQTFSR